MTVSLGYYIGIRRVERNILETLNSAFVSSLADLHGNIDILIYLIENNCTLDTIRYKLESIDYNAQLLALITHLAYMCTGSKKYYLLKTSLDNLHGFLLDILNDKPSIMKNRLVGKLTSLSKISGIIWEMHKYSLSSIPDNLVNKLLNETSLLK